MLYRLFFVLIFGVKYSKALKCYSCEEENQFFGLEKSLLCEDMKKMENLENFIIECPEEYLGCVTQFKGTQIKRTCDTPAIDDCETANGITYCYCSSDLCNDDKQLFTDAHKSLRDINYPSDDEDYTDMSGQGNPDDEDVMGERYDEKKIILSSSGNRITIQHYLIILMFSYAIARRIISTCYTA